MSSGFFKTEAFRLGIIGALVGACAPVLHTLLQLAIFHSEMSISEYFLRYYITSKEEMASNVFIGGSIIVMAVAGYLVGSLREDDARQREKVKTVNRELAALNFISGIINKTRDLDMILHLVLKETIALSFLNIERKGVIFIRDESDPGLLRMAVNIGLTPHLARTEKHIRLGHCLCGKAVQTGETITSTDCFKDEDHTTRYPDMERHGHIVVPITGKQGVVGVMTFYIPPDTPPLSDDIRLLGAIADQLAVAIENVRLVQSVSEARDGIENKSLELAKKVDALNGLVEMDRIILSTFERDEMLLRVVSQIRQLVPSDVGGVALKDKESGDCCYVGGWGLDIRKGDVLVPGGCTAHRGLKSGRPFLWDARSGGPESLIDSLLAEGGVKSGAYVPVIRKGRPTGLLFLGSFTEGGIKDMDVETAVTFASRMGIALEHSRLIYSLEEISLNVILALTSAIDAKSPWTKGHSERVAEYALSIAERIGMDDGRLEQLRLSGLLHDIGKIGTYDMLLDKEGKLTEEELELIKQHPDRGCEILSNIKEFKDILPAVRHHHERWDGKGYPSGLKGEEIPLTARIICVADSFDTMTADRPYRPSIGLDNAVQELKYCSGSQFAPDVAEVFLELIREHGHGITKAGGRAHHIKGGIFAGKPWNRA